MSKVESIRGPLREAMLSFFRSRKITHTLDEVPEDEKSERARRSRQYNLLRTGHFGSRTTHQLTYEVLPELCAIFDTNITKIYSLVGIDLAWPSGFKFIVDICDGLPEETLDTVYSTAWKLSSEWWRTFESHPYLRLPFKKNTLSEKRMFLSSTDFPVFSQDFDLSLHWILALDERLLIYSKRVQTEMILDTFSFMSHESKNCFFRALMSLAPSNANIELPSIPPILWVRDCAKTERRNNSQEE